MLRPCYWTSTENGMPTIGKSTLIGWLAVIHGIREKNMLRYPEVPGIGRLLCHSNQEDWEEKCYSEIQALGEASGLTYMSYINSLCAPNVKHSTSAVIPNTTEDSDGDYDPPEASRGRRRKRCRNSPLNDSTSTSEFEDACCCTGNKKKRGRKEGCLNR